MINILLGTGLDSAAEVAEADEEQEEVAVEAEGGGL